MVGIVIVSHMVSIAEGVRDMAKKVVPNELKIIAAGGTADGSFGTDSAKICRAIEEADDGQNGVIIITDVGSSIISAGLAIEGLSMQLHQRVKIADAPIVEGAIAAASEAAKGSDLMTVLNVTETAKSVSKRGIGRASCRARVSSPV